MSDDIPVSSNTRILCVDLDGTLVHTDLLLESLLCLLRSNPVCIFLLPFWLFQGKARLKTEIASRVDFRDAHLPFNNEVVDYIHKARRSGAYVVLVTGSHQSLADSIASGPAQGLFDEVQGTSADINLTNVRKRDWLVKRFGEKNFDYIGNDTDDLNVWPAAENALAVSSKSGIVRNSSIEFETVFEKSVATWRDYLSLIRAHQWSKNGLIFVPFFLYGHYSDGAAILAVIGAFVAMSLLASATYIFNDMLDLQADRWNTTKCKRVLASGRVSLLTGFIVMAILLSCVCLLMLFLPAGVNLILGIYTITTLLYSFDLKERVMVDVLVLAALHTLRVIVGTLASAADWSFWLLAFSMFVFFSLALAKRVAELVNLERQGRTVTVGRNYRVADIQVLQTMGIVTGFLSVLVVALYINSDKVVQIYNLPILLWIVCPILMYWIGRLWLITSRGLMHEDPIVFVMRDGISLVTVIIIVTVVIMAKIFE